MMCSLSRVVSAGDSKVLLPSVSARGALRFQRYRVFGLIPRPQLSSAPSPFCLPLVQHVEKPVARDGVDVDFAPLRASAAGLGFDEWSGWGDPGGGGSLADEALHREAVEKLVSE